MLMLAAVGGANFAAAVCFAALLTYLPAGRGIAAMVLVAAALQALSGLVNLAPVARCDGARMFACD